MAAIESRNCFIEATLIAGDKSIIKEETNYSAYVVNRKALSVEFQRLAETAAERAGFPGFKPECCLINRYEPGAKLSLHQDRDEKRYEFPIVSVSLGLPAKFLFGGLMRTERPRRFRLENGDVVVWGGPSRLAFHGVDTLADG
jgi:alkylated DNA repair protein (DNA oxidative demethylase)